MKSVTSTTLRSLSRGAMHRGTGITLALPWLDGMAPALAADPPSRWDPRVQRRQQTGREAGRFGTSKKEILAGLETVRCSFHFHGLVRFEK